jgi:hypothetical protein
MFPKSGRAIFLPEELDKAQSLLLVIRIDLHDGQVFSLEIES